ncbi:hypothetical protein V6Z11_A12G163300 [Gossypium hirsutum]
MRESICQPWESPSIIIFGHSCSTAIWTAFLHAIASAVKAEVASW